VIGIDSLDPEERNQKIGDLNRGYCYRIIQSSMLRLFDPHQDVFGTGEVRLFNRACQFLGMPPI
jgi:hypothetical protein